MAQRKLVVVVGVTGNQGGSVARTFLTDPDLRSKYRLRGITRDPASARSQEFASQGVEIVKADLHDPASLLTAFESAHIIFSITSYFKLYFDKTNQAEAKRRGIRVGQLAYELEYDQSRSIADAASKIPTLDRLIVSMVNSPHELSEGHYDMLYHYEAKTEMVKYIKSKYPDLAGKMSELNMGLFYQSWQIAPLMAPQREVTKEGDEVYVQTLTGDPKAEIPWVDPKTDTGLFVKALLNLPAGVHVSCESHVLSMEEWLTLWGKVLGKKVERRKVSVEEYEAEVEKIGGFPEGFGREMAETFEFFSTHGHHGGRPQKIGEHGIEVPGLSSIEKYIENEDWSIVGV